jgi:Integrase core domain
MGASGGCFRPRSSRASISHTIALHPRRSAASCSNSALKSLSPASRNTWSSDPGRPPKDGAPSCVAIHRTSQPWIYSLPRPLASTCSMPSSSCDWPAEISSGSTPPLIRLRNGSDVRSRRRSLGMRLRATYRDQVYGAAATRRLRAMGIRDKPIAPRSPWQNGFAERLIGSIRRECVDHVVVLGETHLRRVLKSYGHLEK